MELLLNGFFGIGENLDAYDWLLLNAMVSCAIITTFIGHTIWGWGK